jgi:hypothetical protein
VKGTATSSASYALVSVVDTACGEEAVLVVTFRKLCAGEWMPRARG